MTGILFIEMQARVNVVGSDVTGEPCEGCGDTPWLSASRLVVECSIAGGEPFECGGVYLCPDCASDVLEQYDGDA